MIFNVCFPVLLSTNYLLSKSKMISRYLVLFKLYSSSINNLKLQNRSQFEGKTKVAAVALNILSDII